MELRRSAVLPARAAVRALTAAAVAAVVLVASASGARSQGLGGAPAGAVSPEVFEAVVVAVRDESTVDRGDHAQLVQSLEVRQVTGAAVGRTLVVENGQWSAVNVNRYAAGDRLVVEGTRHADGGVSYFIADYVRRAPMAWLFALFVVCVVVVGRGRGVASLLGMGLSFVLLFTFVLPQIGAGRDPIVVSVLAAAVIIPITFYLAHGPNRKTTAAVGGTLVTLVLTGLLARLAVDATRMTGFGAEEAYFLQIASEGEINLRGLLMASIIVGLLGILDDITVSQAAIVQQLKRASPGLSMGELYARAMDVGRDHIASLVNTLVLVYASSAMPLLLLFMGDDVRFREAINYEHVAVEVVRTLVASIGLIAAVPITTTLACALVRGVATEDDAGAVGHAHVH